MCSCAISALHLSAVSHPVTGVSRDTGHSCLLSSTGGLSRHSALMGHLLDTGKCSCPSYFWLWRVLSHLGRTEVPLQKFALQFQQSKI